MKSKLEGNKKSSKGKIIISVAIIVLLLAGGLLYYLFFTPEVVEEITYQTSQVKQGDITLSIENTGVITYSDQSTITSTVNGTINQLYIDENSNVNVNDTILKLDERALNIQLEQAYASKKIAEINLANLLQTTVDNVDNATVNNLSTVVAPIDGIVIYNTQEGANVNSGSSVMNVENSNFLYFITQVPVENIEYMEIGGDVEIDVDNYLENIIGTVIKIDITPKYNGSYMFQDVWVAVDNPGVEAGMKGQVAYESKYEYYLTYYYSRGVFENSNEASVYPKISGTIEDIYVEDGQYVTKGTPLFKIDDTSLNNQIETQKQNIYNDELKIQSILLDLEKTTVKATKSGVVSELYVEENQTIGSGAKIADIISESLVASIEVDELDISQIMIGQEATVLIPGYSETEELVGEVSYISESGMVKDGITTYAVEVSFEKNDMIKEGMTVDVAIILAKAENVLKVPSTSVIDIKDGKAVRVMVGEEIIVKNVEIGISDDTMTAIISGLERTDVVITSITYPAGTTSTTTGTSSLVPTTVQIPGVTGGGGGGGGGQ